MLAGAVTLFSCAKKELNISDYFPLPTEVTSNTTATVQAQKDEDSRRVFDLVITDGSSRFVTTLVGDKYFLTANQYTEAMDVVAKKGNFILEKTSLDGKSVKSGNVNVKLTSSVETETGVTNEYSISAILFLEDGTPYKVTWSGSFSFEGDAVLTPEFYYTDTVAADCTDAQGTAYPDVESHTLVLVDESGEFAAQIKLIRTAGTTNLVGEYTVAEYAHEDFTAGNGFDMSPYGWDVVIGSYYMQDGAVVIIEPGEKISVSEVAAGGFYSIEGNGFSFAAAPVGYVPGEADLCTINDTVAADCTDAQGTAYPDVESHTLVFTTPEGEFAAQIKLVRATGTTDLTGNYTVAEYAHEDFTAGNGFDMSPYGWDVIIGSYYMSDGVAVIIEPGETIEVSHESNGVITVEGSTGYSFTGKLSVPEEPEVPTFKYNPSDEYLAETNLWLPADENHYQYPTSGFPTITQDRGLYTFTVAQATEKALELELLPYSPITLSHERYYTIKAKVWVTEDAEVGFSARTISEGAYGFSKVSANTEQEFVILKVKGNDEPIKIVWEIATATENTTVNLYDIVLEDAGDASFFEKDGLFIYDTVGAVTDATWTPVAGLEKHTMTLVDNGGAVVAGFELVVAEGGSLAGDYTCISYPSEAYKMGNGYDLSAWGMGIGGSYYFKDGATVLINEGETMTATLNEDGSYTFASSGYAITGRPAFQASGLQIYDTVGAVTDATWTPIAGLEKHTMTLKDAEGGIVAGFELVVAEGGSLAGEYTCISYPGEDHKMGNGYDLSAWGMGVGGSYYYQGETLVLVNEGETMTLVINEDGSISFSAPAYLISGSFATE